MEYVPDPDHVVYDKRSVVTVGSFDGVHKAHARIIETVVEKARGSGGRAVLVSFHPHPQSVLRPGKPIGLLTSMEERRELCRQLGIDLLCVVPFTYEFSRTPWKQFLKEVIVDRIGVTEIVEGFNHHFGRDREGGVDAIRTVGESFGFRVTSIDPVLVDGVQVSSTVIRHALTEGEVEKARRLLGRPYTLSGTVVHGEKRGAKLGYPTANIVPETPEKLIPANGIYVVSVVLQDGTSLHGLASIGFRPTFHQNGPRTFEVFILDHSSDLYGARLEVGFLRRLRAELKFESQEELIRQMDQDKQDAMVFLQTIPS